MKIFQNIFKQGSKILTSIKHSDQKDLEEIKKLEKQIEILQKETTKEKKEFTISNRYFLKFWFFGMIMVFLGFILFTSLDVLYLILTAYIVSIAMEAVIAIFQRMKLGRGIAISLTYFLLTIFLLSGVILIVPFLINQITEIINILLTKITTFQNTLQTQGLAETLQSNGLLSDYLKKEIFHNFSDPTLVYDIQNRIQTSISQLASMRSRYAQMFGNFAVTFITGFASFLTETLIVITLAILFSIEKTSVIRFIASLGGQKKYKYIYIKLEKIYKKLGIWLKSRLLLSLYIGITMYIALWIISALGMDIPHKASLAVILGLLDIIPYIGPFFGGLPAVIAGFLGFGIWGGIIIAGVVFLINIIENNVLVPLLMNKTLGINTVVIFISIILGGLIMGIVGILLAVPIAAIITLLFEKDFE